MSLNLKKIPSSGGNQTGLKILAILLVAFGLFTAIAYPVPGVVLIVIGSVLLQKRARTLETQNGQNPKSPFRRRWQIIVAVATLFIVYMNVTVSTASITDIQIGGSSSAEVDISETCELTFTYEASYANADAISCISSDESIALTSVQSAEDGVVNCIVTPLKAGSAEIICQAGEITSEPIRVTITDRAAEEAARLAAEKAKKEAEEKAAAEKAAREAAEKAAAEQAAKEAAEKEAAAKAAAKEAAAEQPSSNGKTVYVTPSGKRYHLDPDCGGKNSHPVDISEVGSRTPCKKCAGG